MNINLKQNEDKLIVYLGGELDHHSSEEVRIKIDDMLDKSNINKLIFDFSKVAFMDSSGIGVVIGRYKRLSLKKGEVGVTGVKGAVKRVFELSGMFKIIKLYDSVDSAVKNM
jgi:stage II sporulation protein AA (anti-sigma F factor antagonist)